MSVWDGARLGEALADALTASIGDGVYAIDLGGRLTYLNAAATEILGWRTVELLGVEIHDLLHRVDRLGQPRDASQCRLLEVTRTGVPLRNDDDVFVHRDGRLVPVAYSSSPVVVDGEIVGAVVAFREITAHKEREARLRKEARVYETLLEIATTLNAQRDVASLVQSVIDAGTVVSSAEVGAFLYEVVDERGESKVLCAMSGADRDMFEQIEIPADELPSVQPRRSIRRDDVLTEPEEQRPPFAFMLLPRLTVRSYLGVPVIDRDGEVLGRLLLGHSRPGVFTDDEQRVVEAVAAHAAAAVGNARRFEQEARVSETLQRNMLPRALPDVRGIEAEARYLPAQAGIEVGGDWYDIVPLPGERVAVVIGDVAGHNIRAASVMAEVRNAVRAYAVEGHSPTGVLERTNRFLCSLAPDEMATCCYIELQPREGTATVVLAGHPPPIIRRRDFAAFVDAEPGPPLGVGEQVSYVETTVMLPAGSTVVLYTDGLVDQSDLPLHEGLERLRAAAVSAPPELARAADQLLAETVGADTHDDAALLLVTVTAIESTDPTSVGRLLPADAGSASASRRFVTDVLRRWGVDEDNIDTSQLLVSELVTNAVLHTGGAIALRVQLDGDLVRVSVGDQSGERPATLSDAPSDATSGRGLLLVDELSTAWGVDADGVGKIVWFELAV